MIQTTSDNPKIKEFIAELLELKGTYHGFIMTLSREADVNYNNLSSMIHDKRKMGYKVFFALKKAFPKVKRTFSTRKQKKK